MFTHSQQKYQSIEITSRKIRKRTSTCKIKCASLSIRIVRDVRRIQMVWTQSTPKKVVGIEYTGIKFPKKTNVSKRINNTAHLDYRFPFRSLRLLNRWTSWGTASPTDSQNYFPFFLDEVLPTTYLRRAAPWTEPRYPASSSRVKRLYTNSAFPRSNATVRSAHVKISLRV